VLEVLTYTSTLAPPAEFVDDHRVGVLGWLPVLTVVIFLFMGNIGYGTLIWVVTAELLPPKVRSIANSIIICFAFLCGFVIAKTFVDLLESLGQAGTFFLYGAICVVGTLLTALFVPETRGKSIDEIQKFYYKPRAAAAAARATVTKNPEEEQENTPLSTIRA